ncbi:MAG: peptide-methionine (S)-S-oxide reductase MsrA [Bacteroidia bacterium]|nr:peptide-methionine (S)-S-oxide reductase MsrA [Bacteroidia bacterium]
MKYISSLLLILGLLSCSEPNAQGIQKSVQTNNSMNENLKMATFGAGCFWCVEAVFQELNGVVDVVPGYAGGHVKNPSYKEVCNGSTGHAEVAQIRYNPEIITFDELLEVFWSVHDPTTLNRQGNDVGTQYRSVVFYHDEEQKAISEKYKADLNESGAWDNPIVTEISELSNYTQAEEYHNNYYTLNSEESYCRYVIQPKLDKFRKVFKDKLQATPKPN